MVGKLGPRKTLTYGLIWWSVLTVATALVPPTMANALWVLIAVRFILGLGEAVAYPSSNQFIAAWFPTQERGKANGWVFGGVGLGSGTAPPLVAFIIYTYGWHAVFYVSAVIGLVIAVIWYRLARDTPGRASHGHAGGNGAYPGRPAGQDRRRHAAGAVAARFSPASMSGA